MKAIEGTDAVHKDMCGKKKDCVFSANTRVFAENTRVFAENTRVFAKNTRAKCTCVLELHQWSRIEKITNYYTK